jgi:hypothetical protein
VGLFFSQRRQIIKRGAGLFLPRVWGKFEKSLSVPLFQSGKMVGGSLFEQIV